MLKTVEGIYRDGKVELLEKPGDVEGSRVIVTFMPATSGAIDLSSRGIDEEQAANLRDRLGRFAQDWERWLRRPSVRIWPLMMTYNLCHLSFETGFLPQISVMIPRLSEKPGFCQTNDQ